jgi:hypothetical protein
MVAHRAERVVLVALELFTGVMAIVGTVGLLTGAWREGLPVAWLRGSPFTSYTVPALALFVFVGGSSFLAAVLVLRRDPAGARVSILAGGLLVIFEVVEYLVIGLTFFLQPLMFVVRLVLIALGALLREDELAR